jgi:hypothetical protein
VSQYLGARRLLLPALFALLLTGAPAAWANGSISTGFDDQIAFGEDWSGPNADNTTTAAQTLGAQTMRVHVRWSGSMREEAHAKSCTNPGLDWAQPGSYNFTRPLRMIQNARNRGMRIFLVITSPFPCWVSKEPGLCQALPNPAECTWRPTLFFYEQFLRAVLKATGGVHRISLYNEPNSTKFLTGGSITERALAYRDMWFRGRDIIKGDYSDPGADPSEFPHLASIPLWYGEVAQSDNVDTFLKAAFCYDGAATPPVYNEYQQCDGTDLHVDNASGAEALTFHSYLEDNSPQDQLLYLSGLRRTWSEIRNRLNAAGVKIGAPPYFVATEVGVHHNQSYGTEEDGFGENRDQAAHVNCVEHNLFRDPRVTGWVHYGLQDPPSRPGDTLFTGLRRRDGTDATRLVGSQKPSFAAFRMPLTVFRPNGATSTNLRIWGAWRRPLQTTFPASVTFYGYAGSTGTTIAYQRSIPLDEVTYPNGYFFTTLTDVPTAITRFQIRGGSLASRIAKPTDCDYNGSAWSGGEAIPFN